MKLSDFEVSLYASKSICLITGATGWMGRSVLHELQKLISATNFNDLVYAFGSRPCIIDSTAYRQDLRVSIPVYSLRDICSIAQGRNIRVLHTAFLTKDRLLSYGYSSFVDTNRWITNTVCEALSIASESRVVEISSGAASLAEERGESSLDASVDPYGFLKLREERLLSEISIVKIFRVYALTGRFIRDPRSFALGDFLVTALKGAPICINARGPVIRGYVSASDVAQVALCWLMSQENSSRPVPAITHTVTLSSLAAMISSIFQLPPVISKTLVDPPHSYTNSPAFFLDMLQTYGLKSMKLEDQILETARGLGREIKFQHL